jgi:hypothetical protein
MSGIFLTMLKEIQTQFDRIAKELAGYTFKEVKEGNGKKKKLIQVEIPPTHESKFRSSNALTNLILQFYPNAEIKRTSAATLLQVWTDEVKETRNSNLRTYGQIYHLLQPLLEKFYVTESGLSSTATAWRKPIREKFGDASEIYKQSIHVLGISRERSLARRKEYTEGIRENVRKRGVVKYTQEMILFVIDDAAASTNPIKNIVAVLLATGSRLIEVVKVSTYESVPNKPNLIKVIGVAKDREVKKTNIQKEIIRPLVRLQSDKVLELISRIRDLRDFNSMSNERASGSVNSQVNTVIADYFKDVDNEHPDSIPTTAHKLRYIWASLAFQLYGGSTPEQEWVRSMLGHDSSETSLTYTQLVVQVDSSHKLTDANSLKTMIGELEIDAKKNELEHQEIKAELSEVRSELNKGIEHAQQGVLDFPQFANPLRVRIGRDEQLELLMGLDRAFDKSGLRMVQKDAKRHRFGSTVISAYWKERPAEFS